MSPTTSSLETADDGRARDAAAKLRSCLGERIEWDDIEDSLDSAGGPLRAIAADPELLQALVLGVGPDDFDPHGGPRGAYWFHLEDGPTANASLWLRYCPSGSVVAPHAHEYAFVALVVHGTFKQTLVGIGGGVASPPMEVDLYVRHERPGQLFALAPGQRHSSCSSAESLLLVLTPLRDVSATGGASGRRGSDSADASDTADAKLNSPLRRLRQTIARAGLT